MYLLLAYTAVVDFSVHVVVECPRRVQSLVESSGGVEGAILERGFLDLDPPRAYLYRKAHAPRMTIARPRHTSGTRGSSR